MKIYTKTGDDGQTVLLDGRRVSKDDDRIEAYGTVDELSVSLGLARAAGVPPSVDALLLRIQYQLFEVGAQLATPAESEPSTGSIDAQQVQLLETAIDEFEEHLEPLHHFIVPGGSLAAGFLHQARTICRRAERCVVALSHRETIAPELLAYMNRLSDLLFVLARIACSQSSTSESTWTPSKTASATG
jgi:cob(I)alamin adenosyltransferase